MPSPVGHILAGAAVYLTGTRKESRSRVILAITLLGSILPDFDFLPGILIGDLPAFHHGVSHSLAFAVLFGALAFFFVRRRQKDIALCVGILAASAYASHVLLDLVSVNEGARGVPILWPLSDQQFGFNLHLLGHFHYWSTYRGIWTVMRWDNLSTLSLELVVIGTPALFLLWRERRSTHRLFKPIPEAIRKRSDKMVYPVARDDGAREIREPRNE
jgi:inner membrane protein